jgi:hypothetical protein
MNINMKYGVFAPIAVLLALLAGCTGGSDSDLVPSGATVTITGPIGDLTYLNHAPSFLDNTDTTFYNNWAGIQSGMLMKYDLASGPIMTSDSLSISGTSDNGTDFWVGTPPLVIICTVASLPPLPLCSDWGIAVLGANRPVRFYST